ncbi:hypothetical protein SESBI_39662 [Sesbania bispinosa]|nr:hypothetical protein SESBI_39662 [Sesbania bispinosa]
MRQYKCLSSRAAISYDINMVEFCPQTQGYGYNEPSLQRVVNDQAEKIDYRRYDSITDFCNDGSSTPQHRTCAADSPISKQFMSVRSHKRFPCITDVSSTCYVDGTFFPPRSDII